MKLKTESIKKDIGAIVHVARANILDESVARHCLELLDERGVLVFPRIHLSDDEQVSFTERLGRRADYYKSVKQNPGSGSINRVTLDPEVNASAEYLLGTFFWHMDGLTSDIPPPKATLLSAHEIVSKGGQTEFASTFAAYEYLSTAEKAEIEGLKAVHSLSASLRGVYEYMGKDEAERLDSVMLVKEHPIVWKQSSGRKSLVIGATTDRVAGMEIPEGRALLERLLEWTVQPAFVYSHEWQKGDLVVWNNCGTLHRVIPYGRKSGRRMHRTALAGIEMVQ